MSEQEGTREDFAQMFRGSAGERRERESEPDEKPEAEAPDPITDDDKELDPHNEFLLEVFRRGAEKNRAWIEALHQAHAEDDED